MLRIGKNPKDSVENETSPEKPDVSAYTTPRTFNSYQAPTTEAKPQPEYTPASPKALTESESLAREIKEGNLSGFVGSGTMVTGEANFKAMMRVDGHLSGRVTSSSGTLIVGANGKVDANIEVAIAVIHGTVNGDIIASQRLELGRAAKLNGNIQTASLMIEPGALFEGSCKMIKMNAVTSKGKTNGREDQPLDTTKIKTINADATPQTTEIDNVSSVAS
ncbi:MAG TPA: polymer-forming cytoskeletal protein [Pyrinomonadaceae bacterium]|nr:polymer-forming cytoskeletal protein [Pyrinomonadaceae bacterium]